MILNEEKKLKIIEDIFSNNNGKDFFSSITVKLSTALDVKHVFITKYVDVENKILKSLAYSADGFKRTNFEYSINDTPCEVVMRGEEYYIPENVSKLFPKASQLESYLGVPIRDFSNNMVGHLCIEDVKPMEFGIEIIDFLRIFASRIGSELAHEKLQNQLKTNIEYQKIINSLLEISLNSTSLKEQLQKSLEYVLSIPNLSLLPKGAIYLRNNSEQEFQMFVEKNIDTQLLSLNDIVSYESVLCKKEAQHSQLVYNSCSNERYETSSAEVDPYDRFIVPLQYQANIIGALVLYLKEDSSKNPAKDTIFNSISNVLSGIIIKNKAKEELYIRDKALETAANSIAIYDSKGNFEWVNKAFTKLTGYSLLEVKGKNSRFLKSQIQDKGFYKNLWETITSGKVWAGEMYNKRKDGTIYLEEQVITPVFNDQKICNFIAIKKDITLKKQKEKELIDAKMEAERSNKLKSEFLAQISHEIRTPINTILNYASLLKDVEINSTDREDFLSYHQSIDKAGNRIIRTIELLINMSQIQTGSYDLNQVKLNLINDIILEIIEEHKVHAMQKGLSIKTDFSLDEPVVYCDSYSVSQTIINLLDNAIKYTDAGSITLKVYGNEHNNVCFEIEDTGIGIEREFLKDIFQPFSQEEQGYTRKFEGNGLGLALVKNYCEINHIHITVESEKGKGAKFTLRFQEPEG